MKPKPAIRSGFVRLLDVLISLIALVVTSPLLIAALVLCFIDTKSPLFFQTRVGKGQQPFTLVKFRTMRVGTKSIASHLADTSAITPVGHLLRMTKVDELPQLFNVIRGEMSLVGPRPCLPSQKDLILERESRGVFAAKPGITGLAQVKSIDMSTPRLLAETDEQMLREFTVRAYLKYLLMTGLGLGRGDAVSKE